MNIKVSVVLLTFLLLNIQHGEAAKKRKLKYCSVNNLMECMMEPLWYFTAQHNGTGIPALEEDFENFCFNIHDVVPYCFKKFTQRCASEWVNDVVERTALKAFRQSMDIFCERGGEIRKRFLRHSQCLISQVKLAKDYRQECVRNLQAEFEWSHMMAQDEPDKTKRLTTLLKPVCCYYKKWERCIVGKLEENCSQEAGLGIKDLIYHGSAFLIPHVCNHDRFDPQSPTNECDYNNILPPADFVPKGLGSQSFLSYMFSISCPNVGYGYILSRDT